MPNNPHLNPQCSSCIHCNFRKERKGYVCEKPDAELHNQLVFDEAKDCNHYLPNTNIDDFKETIKGGW